MKEVARLGHAFALPLTEEVDEPTEEATIDGVAKASWVGPAYFTGGDGSEVRQESSVLGGPVTSAMRFSS